MIIYLHHKKPAKYLNVPISFLVHSEYKVELNREGRLENCLIEEKLEAPYLKDYDLLDGGPIEWDSDWDTSNWGYFTAVDGMEIVGAAAVAFKTNSLDLLENKDNLSILWDIRIAPAYRKQGVGAQLMETAVAWSKDQNCTEIKVETQNINVPACKFYSKMGFKLSEINFGAYLELPQEVQLIWRKPI